MSRNIQLVDTRVMDDRSEFPGFDRAQAFLKLLEAIDIDVAEKVVADLGTGFGSLAVAAANSGARVIAIDASEERISEVTHRTTLGGLSVQTKVANLLHPMDEVRPVDIAFLVGVVEYAGLWDLNESVEQLQTNVIKNAFDILKPGGTLVLATKNRLWPPFLLKDIHSEQPLVNFLPRPLADRFSQLLDGKPYREHIHTPSGWERIVQNAGFRSADIQSYYPYFGYQYPVLLSERPSLDELKKVDPSVLPPDIRKHAGLRFYRAKGVVAAATSRLGIPVTQGLIIRAIKG